MDWLNSLLEFGLNAFGKSGGIPTTASGVSLLGSLLYGHYADEGRKIWWDTFMEKGWDEGERAYHEYMAEKLDMTPDEFKDFFEDTMKDEFTGRSRYERSLDEVARWKQDHPDPMDVLVDMVMEQTGGK